MPHSSDSVPLLTFDTRGEADMLCAVLAANGFRALVQEKTIPRLSTYVLRVAAEDAVAAAEFLREQLDRAEADDGRERCLACHAELPPDQDDCPECGWTYAGS
jgi:uncharacterized paraquat-inducible protein A